MSKRIVINSLVVEGIDYKDSPDFVDAYITYGEYEDGTELTEEELDELNEDGSLVHDRVIARLY